MIDPKFLSLLRQKHRCEPLLIMVQLEQLCPNWWMTQKELSGELGLKCTKTLNLNLKLLQKAGLIRYTSVCSNFGTWLWWVKRSERDRPDESAAPHWKVYDRNRRMYEQIMVGESEQWAKRRGYNYLTVRSFLSGKQKLLDGRWQMLYGPYENERGCFVRETKADKFVPSLLSQEERIYVLAGNEQEYSQFLREHAIDSLLCSRYIAGPMDLFELQDVAVLLVGSWKQNPSHALCLKEFALRGCRVYKHNPGRDVFVGLAPENSNRLDLLAA